jgi:hypothetical protein
MSIIISNGCLIKCCVCCLSPRDLLLCDKTRRFTHNIERNGIEVIINKFIWYLGGDEVLDICVEVKNET